MNLTPENALLFFKLYFALLAYTNRQEKIVKKTVRPEDIANLGSSKTADIRNVLYQKPELILRFIADNPENLDKEELAIVSDWQHFIAGDFYILKFLKKYTVFLNSEKEPHLYGVVGLTDPLEEITSGWPPPILLQAVLLPFKGQIIYDGLVRTYNISFGGGIRYDLNETYRHLKAKEGIIESLLAKDGEPQIITSLSNRKPAAPAPDWRAAVDDIVTLTEKMRKGNTPLQSAALSLLRAAAGLAKSTLDKPDQAKEHARSIKSVRRALTRFETQLYGDEFGDE